SPTGADPGAARSGGGRRRCRRSVPPRRRPRAGSAGGGPAPVGLGVDGQLDEREHAVAELLGEGDLRRRAVDARDLEDAPDDRLEVLVGVGHDPAVQVAGPRHRVDLQHLGDLPEVRADVLEPPLGDLEADERQHLVPHGPEVEVGVEADDDASLLELVEARLYRPACDTELAGELHHAGAGGLAQRPDEPGVERIDSPGQHEQCVYHMWHIAGQSAQSVGELLTQLAGLALPGWPDRRTATPRGLEMGETVTARRQDAADRHQPPVLAGIDHVEWWVGNARAFSAFLASAFGFEFVAYAGPETGRRDRVSYVLEQGEVRFLVTGALTPDSPIAEHVRAHGDGVRDVCFRVDDAAAAFEAAVARGGLPERPPATDADEDGEIHHAAIRTYGETVHTFLDRSGYGGPFAPGFVPAALTAPAGPAVGLTRYDHIVGNVEKGRLDDWVEYYCRVLGFDPLVHFDDEQISTQYSA